MPGQPEPGPTGDPDHRPEPRDDGRADGDDAAPPDARRCDPVGGRTDPQPAHRGHVRASPPCSGSCPTSSVGSPPSCSGRRCWSFAALVTALGAHNQALVLTGLILLGLGWSASTVAGSALLNDAAPVADRVRLQGRGDLAMNLAGALGGALSGPVLAFVGYTGLAWGLLLPIAVVVAASVLGCAARPRYRTARSVERRRAPGGTRTHTRAGLSRLPLPVGLRGPDRGDPSVASRSERSDPGSAGVGGVRTLARRLQVDLAGMQGVRPATRSGTAAPGSDRARAAEPAPRRRR